MSASTIDEKLIELETSLRAMPLNIQTARKEIIEKISLSNEVFEIEGIPLLQNYPDVINNLAEVRMACYGYTKTDYQKYTFNNATHYSSYSTILSNFTFPTNSVFGFQELDSFEIGANDVLVSKDDVLLSTVNDISAFTRTSAIEDIGEIIGDYPSNSLEINHTFTEIPKNNFVIKRNIDSKECFSINVVTGELLDISEENLIDIENSSYNLLIGSIQLKFNEFPIENSVEYTASFDYYVIGDSETDIEMTAFTNNSLSERQKMFKYDFGLDSVILESIEVFQNGTQVGSYGPQGFVGLSLDKIHSQVYKNILYIRGFNEYSDNDVLTFNFTRKIDFSITDEVIGGFNVSNISYSHTTTNSYLMPNRAKIYLNDDLLFTFASGIGSGSFDNESLDTVNVDGTLNITTGELELTFSSLSHIEIGKNAELKIVYDYVSGAENWLLNYTMVEIDTINRHVTDLETIELTLALTPAPILLTTYQLIDKDTFAITGEIQITCEGLRYNTTWDWEVDSFDSIMLMTESTFLSNIGIYDYTSNIDDITRSLTNTSDSTNPEENPFFPFVQGNNKEINNENSFLLSQPLYGNFVKFVYSGSSYVQDSTINSDNKWNYIKKDTQVISPSGSPPTNTNNEQDPFPIGTTFEKKLENGVQAINNYSIGANAVIPEDDTLGSADPAGQTKNKYVFVSNKLNQITYTSVFDDPVYSWEETGNVVYDCEYNDIYDMHNMHNANISFAITELQGITINNNLDPLDSTSADSNFSDDIDIFEPYLSPFNTYFYTTYPALFTGSRSSTTSFNLTTLNNLKTGSSAFSSELTTYINNVNTRLGGLDNSLTFNDGYIKDLYNTVATMIGSDINYFKDVYDSIIIIPSLSDNLDNLRLKYNFYNG